jgi:hypothetical protein
MSRVKYYHVFGRVKDEEGQEHVVTVVGKLEQLREKKEFNEEVEVEVVPTKFVKGNLSYNVKQFKRKLTLGVSICHPLDDFDEEVGVEIAKKRIENRQDVGSIETSSVTMLTEDAIMAELLVKLNYIMEHIEEYISED